MLLEKISHGLELRAFGRPERVNDIDHSWDAVLRREEQGETTEKRPDRDHLVEARAREGASGLDDRGRGADALVQRLWLDRR